MTAGAAQILLKQHQVVPGKRILLSGSGPLQPGPFSRVDSVWDNTRCRVGSRASYTGKISSRVRYLGQWGRIREGIDSLAAIAGRGMPYRIGWSVVAAHGTDRVESVDIARLDSSGVPMESTRRTLEVDTLIISYGLLPNNGLARQTGCQGSIDPKLGGFIPTRDENLQSSLTGVYIAGDAAGIGGAELSELEGRIAGAAAAHALGRIAASTFQQYKHELQPSLKAQRRFAALLNELFTPDQSLFSLANDDTIICRCERNHIGQHPAGGGDGRELFE
jgi:D-hydroxyproline dehydrogenase subunit alpha